MTDIEVVRETLASFLTLGWPYESSDMPALGALDRIEAQLSAVRAAIEKAEGPWGVDWISTSDLRAALDGEA